MSTTTSSTSLTAATDEMRSGLARQLGDDTLAVLDRDAVAMGATPLADALGVGDTAPDFRLPDARGGEVALSDLLARGPVVLVFYRGAWCPYCNLQLAAYQGALAEITDAGATLVAISPQTPDASLTLAEQRELAFPVLSDAGNAVAASYGVVLAQPEATAAELHKLGVDLADFNGNHSGRLPAAATFVIGRDGAVGFASVSGDYRWRVGPEEVLTALRSR